MKTYEQKCKSLVFQHEPTAIDKSTEENNQLFLIRAENNDYSHRQIFVDNFTD